MGKIIIDIKDKSKENLLLDLLRELLSMTKEAISILCVILPSFATRILYRLAGHKIGRCAKISILSYVHADQIDIGNDVDIRPFVFIRVKSLSIGDSTLVSFGTQIKGDKDFSVKGNNFIGAHCLINCEENVRFGFYSGLGPRCTLYTHGSFLPVTKGFPVKFEEVVLEDYVWVAMEVTLLPGTYIESNCIINPGVVVKSKIKSNTILETKNDVFQAIDLKKIQRFIKKKNTYYHKKILTDFFEKYNLTYQYNLEDGSYILDKKYFFRSFPEKNVIELVDAKDRKITYDLENFYTSFSTLRIHKNFLFFLRRRFGVILRTNYNETAK